MAGGWSAFERSLRAAGAAHIAGVDEVGRGPLAGPVVVCAVIMPAERRAIAGVTDSKQLGAAERERLAARIRQDAVALALAAASVREIARWNVYQATARAMARALARLPRAPDEVLVDGKPIKTLAVAHHAIVGGDAKCYSIACASIVAKVVRDRLMTRLAARYPDFGWERNAGYGTPTHIAALRTHGLTAHHRVQFCRTALGGQLEL
ncbi:ribonuclease HII [Pseudogemmatithrix spongiicola]|uniref:Ribonuclease HII n=1 Tax=Pseudogemmatithrix spongiicola TaxID=3062599 RepID=A0AA49JVP2_9BACT|nr:ribonuclease HII [Gemmatimonadaceae bacterium 'strain 138']WKW15650.1 ribonuclease HII [Gemmatimonadaceae bacterium 'strain 318']